MIITDDLDNLRSKKEELETQDLNLDVNQKINITEDDELYRRISIHPSHWKNATTVSSAAFRLKKGEDGISVDLARLTTPEKSVLNREKYRLAVLKASVPMSEGLSCVHDPLEDGTNDAHSLIVGNINKGVSRTLARAATPVEL